MEIENITSDFGEKIVLIAKEKFGSQKALADAIGLNPSNVSDWARGKAKPSLEVLAKICKLAEISLDWLVLNKDMGQVINHHEFARIIIFCYEWAKSNNILPNDSLMVSIYFSFENKRKEIPSLTIEKFLTDFKDIYKHIVIK